MSRSRGGSTLHSSSCLRVHWGRITPSSELDRGGMRKRVFSLLHAALSALGVAWTLEEHFAKGNAFGFNQDMLSLPKRKDRESAALSEGGLQHCNQSEKVSTQGQIFILIPTISKGPFGRNCARDFKSNNKI
ncbi:hypothetical protein K438DRAFT_1757397 [Mycena galopus ATCC 62051]|nr:hypothetical protein K438DRAFT_1757397 [Mycena galopus ATCC 62051]